MTTVTTAQTADRPDRRSAVSEAGKPFRQRLLDAFGDSIADDGYRATTVADIVRRARTSRRTFYEHFADKEACFIALLTDANADMIRRVRAAVDPKTPADIQIKQAVTAWIDAAESRPALMLSWIRDSPALGTRARRLQRDMQEGFVDLLTELTDTEELRAIGVQPVSRPVAIVLLGGLRELIAVTVEDGGRVCDITETAVQSATALLNAPGAPPPELRSQGVEFPGWFFLGVALRGWFFPGVAFPWVAFPWGGVSLGWFFPRGDQSPRGAEGPPHPTFPDIEAEDKKSR